MLELFKGPVQQRPDLHVSLFLSIFFESGERVKTFDFIL